MTKKMLAMVAMVAAMVGAGVAVGGGAQEFQFAPNGAMVLNFGNGKGGRVGCGADCGGGACVVDGKLSLVVTPSGNAGLNCNDGLWLLPTERGGISGTIDCGDFGNGLFRVTPSARANFFCKT